MGDDVHFDDFTDSSYARIVGEAATRYAFEPFGTTVEAPHVLWRHDVDFTVHRGVRMAEIEADAGARATYLLSLRSPFYNLFEAAVLRRARRIGELGHWFGLHFDFTAYDGFASDEELAEALSYERRVLGELIEAPVEVLSFHNPGASGAAHVDADELAGMRNVYGAGLRESYHYVSDSNGYWRHERLPEVIEAAEWDRLHVLTHPEWWQEEAMSPSERLERCLQGRADYAREWYEGPVRAAGRHTTG
jgi:hypothetical protein